MASRQVELIVRRSGQPEQRLPIGPGITHMGRAEDNDLVLPDIGVSRRHARIVVDDDAVRFEDLGSGNGSFHRGRRIEQQVVEDGDEVVIEPFVLQFRIVAQVPAAAALEDDETLRAPSMDSLGGSPARLVVLAGHRLASGYPLADQPVTMGRSEGRDIVLFDPAASRNHAHVELRAEGFWLKDNDSANGTYVNGRRTTQHPLSTGDVIRIGSTEFRFELLGPLPVPERPGDDPTIRAPESLPVVPPAPPALVAPPPQRPAPRAADPTPIAPAPAPAASAAEQVMWARGAAEQAAAPAPAAAPEPPATSGTSGVVIALTAAIGFMLVVLILGGGVGGWYFYQQSQLAEAKAARVDAAQQAIMAPDDDEAVQTLLDEGRLLFHEGRSFEAASRFYKVLQQQPGHPEATRMGYVVVEQIALDRIADDALLRSLDDRQRRDLVADAHRGAERALAGRADLIEAREAVGHALRIDPTNAQLLDDHERVRAAITAGATAAEVARLHKKVAPIYQSGADALASGDDKAAAAAFQKVLKADPQRRTWYWYEAQAGLAEAGGE